MWVHRLRATAVVVAAMMSTANADTVEQPKLVVGGSLSLGFDLRYVSLLTNLELGYHPKPDRPYWLVAGFGYGGEGLFDAAGTTQVESRAVEGRVGVGWMTWGKVGAALATSLGLRHGRMEFSDALAGDSTDIRDVVFLEVRGVGRARLASFLAFEAFLGIRGELNVRKYDQDDRRVWGSLIGGIGLLATL